MHTIPTVIWVVWIVTVILSATFTLIKWNQRRKRGSLFPVIGQDQILYKEFFGSGRSLNGNPFAGANNCLKLVVTPDELWVTPIFPFSVMAEMLDLEHRILKKDIVSLHEDRSWLLGGRLIVEFRREDGQLRRFEFRPSRYEPFKQALLTGTLAAFH
jgi:hypothetical protein